MKKHKPSESIFDSGRLPVDTGKSLDKYLNSELIRRSQLSTKLSRQPNTDREDDIVILGSDGAYQEEPKRTTSGNVTTQQRVMAEMLQNQKRLVQKAVQVGGQIGNELGNLLNNEVELDDEELGEIDQQALLSFVHSTFD